MKIKDDEMIIKRKEYIDLLMENAELKEKASPFYKYSINEIRKYCGFPPIKKRKEEGEQNMKIIDLLNKIANGEEVPKKIKFMGNEFIWRQDLTRYVLIGCEDGIITGHTLTDMRNIFACLHDKVEIINDKKILQFDKEKVKIGNSLLEEKKIPEKLELPSFVEFKTMSPEARYVVTAKEYDVLNDIIDYLKSKGE